MLQKFEENECSVIDWQLGFEELKKKEMCLYFENTIKRHSVLDHINRSINIRYQFWGELKETFGNWWIKLIANGEELGKV